MNGVFLDFSKAFNTVNHNILLQKMDKYGICGIELKWFENYLSNRMQYVTYNNHKSSHEKIHCGVPQGSILGPIFFLLYINDLTSVSEFCFSVLFADDTNMFITGKDMDILCHQLNEDLRNIQEWLQWMRYSKLYIWPWKLKVKVMAKVKPDGHIWALEFNRYVCLLFRGNRTIFGWDIANSIFDLEKSRSRSRRKSPKI